MTILADCSGASANAIRIRRLEARDEARWKQLFKAYIDFYGDAVPAQVVVSTFERLVAGQDLVGLVAIDANDTPVGLANLVFHPATWSASCHCYLEDLYVEPALQGRGAGRLLIDATYTEADSRGADRTYWFTRGDNVQARKLYDKLATLSPFVQYRR